MKAQKVRMLLVVALLSVMMVAGNVFPAAAQSPTPVKMGCWFQGKSYPLGTVLRFLLPYPEPTYVYMRCEWKIAPGPGGTTPQWVTYGSNPS